MLKLKDPPRDWPFLVALLAIPLSILILATIAYSQRPTPHPKANNQEAASYGAGTPESPFIVQLTEPPENKWGTDRQTQQPAQESWRDWLASLSVDQIIALILFLQLGAFGWQAIQLGRTIKTMKAAERRQLRAYVFVGDARRRKPREKDQWQIFLTIGNYGNTPAYKVRTVIDKKIVDSSEENTFVPDSPTIEGSIMQIAPNKTITIKHDFPELADVWDDFKAMKKMIFFWGRTDFVDVFNEPRWITFRVMQRGDGIITFAYCADGNENSDY